MVVGGPDAGGAQLRALEDRARRAEEAEQKLIEDVAAARWVVQPRGQLCWQ